MGRLFIFSRASWPTCPWFQQKRLILYFLANTPKWLNQSLTISSTTQSIGLTRFLLQPQVLMQSSSSIFPTSSNIYWSNGFRLKPNVQNNANQQRHEGHLVNANKCCHFINYYKNYGSNSRGSMGFFPFLFFGWTFGWTFRWTSLIRLFDKRNQNLKESYTCHFLSLFFLLNSSFTCL